MLVQMRWVHGNNGNLCLDGTFLEVQWLRLGLPMQGMGGSTPGQGAKIQHALWPKCQNIKQKRYCNKFNKDFRNSPYQEKKVLKRKERILRRVLQAKGTDSSVQTPKGPAPLQS